MPLNKSVLELIAAADKARKKSDPSFSHFRVGAAIETKSGQVYSAFNIESSSFGLSMCAERIAIWKAITFGETDFRRVAIVSDADEFCPPCGACRQVMFEFAGDIDIFMTNRNGGVKKQKLSSLLPQAFTAETMSRARKGSSVRRD